MGFGISGAGGEGGSYKSFSLTTNATADTEDTTDLGQAVYRTIIYNDSDTDIEFGFDASTATSNKSFTVKAGKSLEIVLVYQTLYNKCSGMSKAFRVLVTY